MTDETSNESGAQSKGLTDNLRDLIERTFLAGMGAAALTKDRIQELTEEFVKRGQLSSEEGKEVVDRLLTRSREEARSVLKKADESLRGAYREFGPPSKRDFEDLAQRLEDLERRVQSLERGTGGGTETEAPAPSAE